MKHNLKITLLLVFLFLLSHFVGLFIVKHYLPTSQNLPLNIEKPQLQENTSFLYISIIILVSTSLILLLLKFRAFKLFRVWYFFSIFVTLAIAFSAFAKELVAVIMALIFAIIRLFKPNTVIHNFTELFVYGGLAAIFVPVLNIFSALILLLIISVYDMIAVWKTKHMISLAKFQASSNAFAGLSIPYKSVSPKAVRLSKSSKFSHAILGGGDIGFTLMFSGAVLKGFGFFPALIVSLFASLFLLGIFVFARKDRFYPAMPFLTVGCIVGLLFVKLLF